MTSITYAPVKGLALDHVDEVELEPTGVRENRRFHLIGDDGRLVNGKVAGTLVQVAATADRDGTTLVAPLPRRLACRTARSSSASPSRRASTVGPSRAASSTALSRRRCRSSPGGRSGSCASTSREPDPTAAATAPSPPSRAARSTAFAREAGEESVDGRRFRMLFEIDGVEPHGEDAWAGRRVAIGDAVVRIHGLVGRCPVTSQNPGHRRARPRARCA